MSTSQTPQDESCGKLEQIHLDESPAMATLGSILLNNILPVFIIIAAGVWLDRKWKVDKRSLTRLALYVLAPCLLFSAIVQSTVDIGQLGAMIAYVLVYTVLLCAIAWGIGKLLRWTGPRVDALVLTVAFVNAGNFGLPIMLLAFGQSGLDLGTAFFVASNLTLNSLAAFFATRSNGGGIGKALAQTFKLPGIYAFALALLVRTQGWVVPAPIFKPIELVGRGCVPIMLLMLGVQLSQTKLGKHLGPVSLGVALRLLGGAALAWAISPLFGLQGLARNVAIAESATPTAVNSALLAIEFGADADYVGSAVFLSTLCSAVTLTILLYFMR